MLAGQMGAVGPTHEGRARASELRPRERGPVVASPPAAAPVALAPRRRAVPANDPLAAQLMRAVRERAERRPWTGGLVQRAAVGSTLTTARQPLIQRVPIGGIDVDKQGRMPTWEQGGNRYHLNMATDPPHITQEGRSKGKKSGATKTHFFFRVKLGTAGWEFSNATSGQRGKKKWEELPGEVRTFVATYYDDLL